MDWEETEQFGKRTCREARWNALDQVRGFSEGPPQEGQADKLEELEGPRNAQS